MRVLLCVDTSIYSRAAVQAILAREWESGTVIKIISVVEPFQPMALGLGRYADYTAYCVDWHRNLLEQTKKHVEFTAGLLSSRFSREQLSFAVIEGFIVESILQEAIDWKADLLMLGSHGRTGLDSLLMGSVSSAVLNGCACSIEIVKLGSSDPERKEEVKVTADNPFKILIPVDYSHRSGTAVERACQFTWPAQSEVRLLHVIDSPGFKYGSLDPLQFLNDVDAAKSDAQELLQGYEKQLREACPEITISAKIEIGDPRKTIENELKEWQADLLLISSHGRKGIARLFLGSVAQAVVARSHCSAHVVKPGLEANKQETDPIHLTGKVI